MYIYVFLFLDPNEDFLTELKLWAVQNNISMTAVSSLLKILRRHVGLFFPKDARTLLKFPEKVHETILSGQNYNFFEPTNILRNFFNEYYDKFNERPDDVTLPSSKKVKHGEMEKEGMEEEEKSSSDDDSGIESLTSFVYSHFKQIHFTEVTRKIWNVG